MRVGILESLYQCVCLSVLWPEHIFWSAQPFVTKLGMVVHHHELSGVSCEKQTQHRVADITYLSTHTVYQYKIKKFSHYFGGIWPYWKMDTGKHNLYEIFCFKLSKKTEKLLNEQLTHAISKCSLTGLVQRLRSLTGSEIWSHACVFSTTCASWNSKWAATNEKAKGPGLHKGSTGSQTLD